MKLSNMQKTEVVVESLIEMYNDFKKYLDDNEYKQNRLTEESFVPIYSYEYGKEKKKLKKMLKAIKRVHNYYTEGDKHL